MNKVNFKPAEGYILLEFPEIQAETPAGILKPGSALEQEKAEALNKVFLKVEAVSDTSKYIVGNMIWLANGHHPIAEIDGKGYFIVNEQYVCGKRIKNDVE